jgi:hypothetical protein
MKWVFRIALLPIAIPLLAPVSFAMLIGWLTEQVIVVGLSYWIEKLPWEPPNLICFPWKDHTDAK